MADVRPFSGLRPLPDMVKQVASPPYDVLSSEEARALARDKPESFLHVIKPEIDLPGETDLHADEVYHAGAQNLASLVERGVLLQDSTPCFYVYRLTMGGHSQVGVVACASVDDYEADVIKKHEKTREDKERDRTRHVLTCKANTGPVFLTYRASSLVDELVKAAMSGAPVYDFDSHYDVRHSLWLLDAPQEVSALRDAFGKVEVVYVADGHHRSASATRARQVLRERAPRHTGEEEYNFFLSVLFPHDQMQILAYNRVVRDLCGLEEQAFLAAVGETFEVSSGPAVPAELHRFGMYLGGRWHELVPRPGIFDQDDPVGSLDVSILQDRLLAPLLGVENPRTDQRIHFVGGIRGAAELERLVDSGEYQVAFSLFPVTVEQLMAIADAGRLMPPKSTWFEPKLLSGVLVHLL